MTDPKQESDIPSALPCFVDPAHTQRESPGVSITVDVLLSERKE